MTWPNLIREARRRAHLSQRELAERAGTSQSAVARWESGTVSPNVDTLERLLSAAGFGLHAELAPSPGPDPVIEAYMRDVDRTLLRANLVRSVEERLRGLMELDALGRELDRAAAARRRGE